jgi:hypothetical protein
MQVKVDFQEPDRKKRIKRIVAREGLILLGILGASCLLFFISSIYPPYFKPPKTTPKKEVYTREQFDVLDNGGLTVEQIARLSMGQYPVDVTAKIEAKKALTDEDIKTIDRIDGSRAELDRRTEAKRNRIRWGGLQFILVIYALYLIPIRFSIWAVKTLKSKA